MEPPTGQKVTDDESVTHLKSLSCDLAEWRSLSELAYGQAAEDDVKKIIAYLKADKASFSKYVRNGYDLYPNLQQNPSSWLSLAPTANSSLIRSKSCQLSSKYLLRHLL